MCVEGFGKRGLKGLDSTSFTYVKGIRPTAPPTSKPKESSPLPVLRR